MFFLAQAKKNRTVESSTVFRSERLKILSRFKKSVRTLLMTPVLMLLLFEEWGWQPLARAFATLGRLPWWGQLEQRIVRLSPWASLLAFGVPVLALIPLKLLALYLLGQGHFVLGFCTVVAAKIVGTAIAARLFQLTHPALMRMAWFARLYTPWKRWKDEVLSRVRTSLTWRLMRRLTRRVKAMRRLAWARIKAVCLADAP